MQETDHKAMRSPPPVYALMYPALAAVARKHGYALAVHGSMTRDFDLVAIPWVGDAGDPLPMVEEMKAVVEGVWTKHDWDDVGTTLAHSTMKPHGRRSWSIHLTNKGCNGPYIDLSVMPYEAVDEREVKKEFELWLLQSRPELSRESQVFPLGNCEATLYINDTVQTLWTGFRAAKKLPA